MSREKHYVCKNQKSNCPHAINCDVFVVGGPEKWECPLGLNHFNPDDGLLERVNIKSRIIENAKRVAFVAVPVVCALLVWLVIVTRPQPPFSIDVNYTTPPAATIHPGGTISWTFSIKGGKPSDKPAVSFDSLTPSLLSKTDLKLEIADALTRKYTLTARTIAGPTGQAQVRVSAGLGEKSRVVTNLAFQIVLIGPPMLTLKSSPPLTLDAAQDSLVIPFTVSDEKTDAEKLIFSATVNPSEIATANTQVDGGSRIVTLLRNHRAESGPVKLAVRVVAPDGRETNQTFDVAVVPPPVPPLAINIASTFPQSSSVAPQQEMTWTFTIEGGPPSQKPSVSAQSLSPGILSQDSVKVTPTDDSGRNYKLVAYNQANVTEGAVSIKIMANAADSSKETTVSYRIENSEKDELREADRLVRNRQENAAITKCDSVLARNPKSKKAWWIKGYAFYSQKNFPRSIECCDKALEIDPNDSDSWFTKGSVYEAERNSREAIRCYNRWLELTPGPDPRKDIVRKNLEAWKVNGYP